MDDERAPIPFDEAVKWLPDRDQVHTRRGTGVIQVGAKWGRKQLIAYMKRYGVERSGPNATAQGYALVIFSGRSSLFIESSEPSA